MRMSFFHLGTVLFCKVSLQICPVPKCKVFCLTFGGGGCERGRKLKTGEYIESN